MRYREGKNNTVADALSRRADHHNADNTPASSHPDSTEELLSIDSESTTTVRDQIQQLKASYLADDYTSARLRQPDKYTDTVVKNGLLYDTANRLVIPDDRALKTRILYEASRQQAGWTHGHRQDRGAG